MNSDDRLYLGHMLDSAREAVARIAGKDRRQFHDDPDLRLATAHRIQIIGEAARMVSEETRQSATTIP